MDRLSEEPIACPCCGEAVTLLIDTSVQEQSYVEDCTICCQPFLVRVLIADEHIHLETHPENE